MKSLCGKIKKAAAVYLAMLMGLTCWAQDMNQTSITLKLKIYLESDGYFPKMAKNLKVRVDETFDHSIEDFVQSSGRFSKELDANKHYIIYFSADGYETKSLVFSTVGFQSEDKHVFRVKITLERIGGKNYLYPYQSVFVQYDYINTAEFVIVNEDARISHLIK